MLGAPTRAGTLEAIPHIFDQIYHPLRIPPLVVVPGEDLYQISAHNGRAGGIDDGAGWVPREVHGNQGFFRYV